MSSSLPSYNAAMEWSSDRVLKFLELYFGESAIWNPKDGRHKDRNEVFDAWKRIEEAFAYQHTIAELKKKRENLMSTYRKLNRKVQAAKTIGESFNPEWFAYETIARHMDQVYEPKTIKQLDGEDDTISEFEETMHSEEDTKDFMEVPVIPQVVMTSPACTTSTFRTKRKRKTYQDDSVLEDSSQDGPKKPQDDGEAPGSAEERALFCELLSIKLKALNEQFREAAMFEINNIMYHFKTQQQQSLQQQATHCVHDTCATRQPCRPYGQYTGYCPPSHLQIKGGLTSVQRQ